MILIYTEEITPRIDYIFRLVFNQILRVEIAFTANSSEFQKSELPKFNYSYQKFGDELYIKPHRLLSCKALIAPNIQSVWFNGEKYFFESSADSILPFDPFAASFYVVTRYEEYLESEKDKFERYPASKSILAKYNLLKKPIVNIWANLLAKEIKLRYPEFEFPEQKFEFISTIDVDNAWAYLHKGFWRSTASILKSLLKGNVGEVKTRFSVLTGMKNDPYDSYAYMDSIFEKNRERVKFFFLLGDYRRYDKNISHKNRHFRNLIRETAGKYDVGIHPSFASSKKRGKKKVLAEIQKLEKITGKKIEKSRQHFVRLHLPKTYRRLLKANISEDFTMGYATENGFRAGICTPFYFYDLKRDMATKLKITPFQVMDVTMRDYLELSPEDALKESLDLMKEVKKVGGTFVCIWHNETVTDLDRWTGYRNVFEKINKTGFEWANE
ncbi:MAG: polysaccharide deacetylase family protein [Draconibacterium sp.]